VTQSGEKSLLKIFWTEVIISFEIGERLCEPNDAQTRSLLQTEAAMRNQDLESAGMLARVPIQSERNDAERVRLPNSEGEWGIDAADFLSGLADWWNSREGLVRPWHQAYHEGLERSIQNAEEWLDRARRLLAERGDEGEIPLRDLGEFPRAFPRRWEEEWWCGEPGFRGGEAWESFWNSWAQSVGRGVSQAAWEALGVQMSRRHGAHNMIPSASKGACCPALVVYAVSHPLLALTRKPLKQSGALARAVQHLVGECPGTRELHFYTEEWSQSAFREWRSTYRSLGQKVALHFYFENGGPFDPVS